MQVTQGLVQRAQSHYILLQPGLPTQMLALFFRQGPLRFLVWEAVPIGSGPLILSSPVFSAFDPFSSVASVTVYLNQQSFHLSSSFFIVSSV